MVAPFQTVGHEIVAKTGTFDGRRVKVKKVDYDRAMPGGEKHSYSVDVTDSTGAPERTHGFVSLDDALRFVTSHDAEEYDTLDAYGNVTKETRTGLGIPEGMVANVKKPKAEQPANYQDAPLS